MNLAIRGIDGQIAHGDSFHNDRFPDLKADYILANPPFNVSDWRGDLLLMDQRWQFGVPPAGNANFAWVQHIIHHLAPTGLAGFVLANGSMSSNQAGEGEIRKNIIEADLVDCMVALPGQLFYSTQIPACLWFLARDKSGKSPAPSLGQGWSGGGRFRDRRGQVLFIDARKLGRMVDRTHRELTDEEIARIAHTYHAWRGTLSSPALRERTGVREQERSNTTTSPASARALHWRRSVSTAMCSRPAATSAPRRRRTTASPSRRRCGGSPRNCASSRPRPGGWMRRSGGTCRSWGMTLEELRKEKREAILRICAKHGVRNVRVFGSVARGEADEQSDIDFLVDMEPGRTLLDLGGLLMDLRSLLGEKVDVVTERGLKPRIRDRVLAEAVAL